MRLQLLYKLIQLSLRYNKRFSFNIAKSYSEHFTTTDSKFCNILSTEFFQVASKNYFFVFAYDVFLYKSEMQVLKSREMKTRIKKY